MKDGQRREKHSANSLSRNRITRKDSCGSRRTVKSPVFDHKIQVKQKGIAVGNVSPSLGKKMSGRCFFSDKLLVSPDQTYLKRVFSPELSQIRQGKTWIVHPRGRLQKPTQSNDFLKKKLLQMTRIARIGVLKLSQELRSESARLDAELRGKFAQYQQVIHGFMVTASEVSVQHRNCINLTL